MADTSDATKAMGGLIEMPQQQLLQITILGLATGAAAWIIGLLIKAALIVPLFCGDPSNAVCVSSTDTANNIAAVIITIIGLMGLVRLSVYRPLLIVLAVLVSLWGLGGWTASLQWYETLAWFVILYALAYVAFSWLVRPRAFAPMLAVVIVAVVLVRILPAL